MSKSAEDLYTEKVEGIARDFLTENLAGIFGAIDVQDFLAQGLEDSSDPDLVSDVVDALDSTLDTMLQRLLDD